MVCAILGFSMADFYPKPRSIWRENVPILVLLFVLAIAILGGVALLSNEQQKTEVLISSLQKDQVSAIGIVEEKRPFFPEHDVIEVSGMIPLAPIDGWQVFFPTKDSSELNGLSRKLVSNLLGQPPIMVRTVDERAGETVETWVYVVDVKSQEAVYVYFRNGEAYAAKHGTYEGTVPVGLTYAEIN